MTRRLTAVLALFATLLLGGCGYDYGTDQLGRKVASERLDGQWFVLNYWAEWCGPCKMIAPVLDEIAQTYQGKLKVCKLNIDENQDTPPKYNVRGILTLMLFKNGAVEATKVGALSKSQLAAFLDSNI